jgi:hypothetical protein
MFSGDPSEPPCRPAAGERGELGVVRDSHPGSPQGNRLVIGDPIADVPQVLGAPRASGDAQQLGNALLAGQFGDLGQQDGAHRA